MRLSESLTDPADRLQEDAILSTAVLGTSFAGARRRTTDDRYCYMIRKVVGPGRAEPGAVWQERCSGPRWSSRNRRSDASTRGAQRGSRPARRGITVLRGRGMVGGRDPRWAPRVE